MKAFRLFILLLLFTSACTVPEAQHPLTPQPVVTVEVPAETPTVTEVLPHSPTEIPTTAATESLIRASEVYTNSNQYFSIEHPAQWVVTANDADSGFISKQVF
jgi:hypothetical protein